MQNVISSLLLLTLTGFMILNPQSAGAANDENCNGALKSDLAFYELLQPMWSEGTSFLKRLRKGLGKRYAQDPEVLSLTAELTDGTRETGKRIPIKWNDTIGAVRISRENGVLSYTLDEIIVIEDGKALLIGQRPRRPNSSFARILTALTEALRVEILRPPEIEKVELRMGVVRNAGLLELLKGMGFRLIPRPQSYVPQPSHEASLFRSQNLHFMDQMMIGIENLDRLELETPHVFSTPSSSTEEPDLGRSLHLVLQVKP